MPKVGDMIHSTPAKGDPCQGEMPSIRSPSIPKRQDSTGKSAHANRDIDAHYGVIKVYMF